MQKNDVRVPIYDRKNININMNSFDKSIHHEVNSMDT